MCHALAAQSGAKLPVTRRIANSPPMTRKICAAFRWGYSRQLAELAAIGLPIHPLGHNATLLGEWPGGPFFAHARAAERGTGLRPATCSAPPGRARLLCQSGR